MIIKTVLSYILVHQKQISLKYWCIFLQLSSSHVHVAMDPDACIPQLSLLLLSSIQNNNIHSKKPFQKLNLGGFFFLLHECHVNFF